MSLKCSRLVTRRLVHHRFRSVYTPEHDVSSTKPMKAQTGKNHDTGQAGTSPFARLSAKLDYPLYIVTTTANDDGERSGCLIGFATQCSIHPPRFLACI